MGISILLMGMDTLRIKYLKLKILMINSRAYEEI